MPCALLGVASGAGRLVAVGGAGHIRLAQSSDHWSLVPQVTQQDLYAVARGPGRFVAVGARGLLLIASASGTLWHPLTAMPRHSIRALTIWGRSVVGGGDLDTHVRLPR